MLNRTNRTLSAHLNRLNLGTRSLALKSGVNIDGQTLRSRHAHCVVMRDGMREHALDPVSRIDYGIDRESPHTGLAHRAIVAHREPRGASEGRPRCPRIPRRIGRSRRTDRIPSRSLEDQSQAPSGPWTQGEKRGRHTPSGGRLRAGRGFAGARARAASESAAATRRGVGRVSAVVPAQYRRIVGPMPRGRARLGESFGRFPSRERKPGIARKTLDLPPRRLADRDQAVTVSRRICARHRHVRRWTLREPDRRERSRCLARAVGA